eukprot:3765366-Pyramimonas_sp.AAC.1
MVHYVLDRICTAHPRMGHRIWVGDLAQRAVGSPAQVCQQFISSLKDTCRGLTSMKLRVANKSIVLCSHHADAAE